MCLGIPARVLSVSDAEGISRPALVLRGDGARIPADLAMVPDAAVGDYVVTHSGFAVSILTKEEALEATRLLNETGNSLLRNEDKESTQTKERQ